MHREIEEVEFVIFDTETTGLDPKTGDRIVEIAALRLKGDKKIATFESLVNPQREISEAAFAVNRISSRMLKDAPLMEEIMPRFLDFIQGSCLCSYNAGFDLGFLNQELILMNKPVLDKILVVDVLRMAKRLLPGLERYALWFVADTLNIKIKQEHRAFSDVELTWGVFRRLKGILQDKGINDFKNFTNLFSINSSFVQDINNQKISEIQQAIDLGVKVKIKYLSSVNSAVTERVVSPKEIRREKNHFYLVGLCHLRNDERSFRIDGILHLEIV